MNKSGGTNTSQTVTFEDSHDQWSYNVDSQPDATFDEAHYRDDMLGDFLSRPVLIREYSWGIGATLEETFDPWSLFLENAQVAARLQHYFLLRCKLRVKVVINGNSFFYGRTIMSYQPLATFDEVSPVTVASDLPIVAFSQRPHIYIDPTLCQGGEMLLPFFFYKNWMDIPEKDYNQMGRIHLWSFGPLKHANDATDSVDVTIFAWAEDVSLCVPTTHLISQVDDEYNDGIVSKPASAIAKVAGSLTKVPYIGVYARATEKISNAVSSVARLFGFSRLPIVTEIVNYKPCLVGNLSVTDQDETVTKLVVDSKQELTVDPRTVGLSNIDEMSISSIAQRESYFTQFTWELGFASNHILFSTAVTPVIFRKTGDAYDPTAVCFASQPFQYWSGTLKYRFQIVASEYHKGRLRILYDPLSYTNATTANYNTAYTRVVDLSKERDFEIDVSWAQDEPYKLVDAMSTNDELYTTGVSLPGRRHTFNGTLTVIVLNKLTVPNTAINNDITVNVFVSGGEDLEFSAPTNVSLKELSYFDSQSMDEEEDASVPVGAEPIMSVGNLHTSLSDMKNMVFFGETITSFRQLLRRYWYHSGRSVSSTAASGYDSYSILYNDCPAYRGFDPNGIDSDSASNPYNYCNTVLLNYLMPAYVARRGGLRFKYVGMSTHSQHGNVSVARQPYQATFSTQIIPYAVSGSSASTFAHGAIQGISDMGSGGYVTPSFQQPCAEVEVPFYSTYRFAMTRQLNTKSGISDDNTDRMGHQVTYIVSSPEADVIHSIQKYVSVGEDFSLFFFLNAPRIYAYSDPTPA